MLDFDKYTGLIVLGNKIVLVNKIFLSHHNVTKTQFRVQQM